MSIAVDGSLRSPAVTQHSQLASPGTLARSFKLFVAEGALNTPLLILLFPLALRQDATVKRRIEWVGLISPPLLVTLLRVFFSLSMLGRPVYDFDIVPPSKSLSVFCPASCACLATWYLIGMHLCFGLMATSSTALRITTMWV